MRKGGRVRRSTIFLILLFLAVTACPHAWAGVQNQRYILGSDEVLPVYHEGQKLSGTSAWYGKRAHGNRTASGSRFDWRKMTAAHRTLPFGTRVRVTNTRNHKNVVVTITDRGPSSRSYVLDVSRGAAEKLSMVRAGVASVTMEILELPKWYKKSKGR